MKSLEDHILEYTNREFCHMTGRASSSIYVALRSLELPIKGKVVIPSISCLSPATASYLAGFEPVFVDINLADFNLSIKSLKDTLEMYDDIVAIIAIHLYGQPCQMEEILKLAKLKNIRVIEDAAQSLGTKYLSKPTGSWGDISVVSFGHTKQIDAGWGGAILTNDQNISKRIEEEISLLPSRPINIDKLFDDWRKLYYPIYELTYENKRLSQIFHSLPDIFSEMYLFSYDRTNEKEIIEKLKSLQVITQARKGNANLYSSMINSPKVIHPKISDHSSPWRYSFLVPEELRDDLVSYLRDYNIEVSTWYPPIYNWYKGASFQKNSQFKNANNFSKRVINLWVDPDLSFEKIEKTCKKINKFLEK